MLAVGFSLQHSLCLVLAFGTSRNETEQNKPKTYLLFKTAAAGVWHNIRPSGGVFGSLSLRVVNVNTVEHKGHQIAGTVPAHLLL